MAVQFKDYYEALGVDRNASQDEIQRKYRELARKYHPDVNKESDAAEKFSKITEAYQVLKDPEKRKKYDQLGQSYQGGESFTPPPGWEEHMRGSGFRRTGDAGGFSDFFEMFFGSGGAAGDEDLFEQILREGGGQTRGGRRAGGGRGGRGGFSGGFGGGPQKGQNQETEVTIGLEEAYHGATRQLTLQRPDGTTRQLDVKVPAGTTDGSRIRLKGQGAPGVGGGEAGDLLIRVRIAPHPRFRVSGSDLVTTLPIAPWEAALGAKVPAPTLDGEVQLTVPPGSQSGQKLRLRERGLPQRGGTRGDEYVELKIVVPKEPSEPERELYEQLKETSAFDPRGSGSAAGSRG